MGTAHETVAVGVYQAPDPTYPFIPQPAPAMPAYVPPQQPLRDPDHDLKLLCAGPDAPTPVDGLRLLMLCGWRLDRARLVLCLCRQAGLDPVKFARKNAR